MWPGYFLPKGVNNECKQCSVLGCKLCHGNTSINYCDSCFSGYFSKYLKNHLTCIEKDINCISYNTFTLECLKCNQEYILYEGKCLAFDFVAVYKSFSSEQTLKLTSLNSYYIDKIIIDDDMIEGGVISLWLEEGYHTVYFFIKNNPTSFANMFKDCINLVSINFTNHIRTTNIYSLQRMFMNCKALISIEFSNSYTIITKNVINTDFMFENCISLKKINIFSWNLESVESMRSMFYNCSALKTIIIGNLNVPNVKNISHIFYECKSLEKIKISLVQNVSKLVNMYCLFCYCESLKVIDLSSFAFPNVEVIEFMFYGCTSLKLVNFSNPTFNNLQYMRSLFSRCSNLTSVDFKNFKTENVIKMNDMFYSCQSITSLNLDSFKTSKVNDMRLMFYGCNNLVELHISNFRRNSSLNCNSMFPYNSHLTIYADPDFLGFCNN